MDVKGNVALLIIDAQQGFLEAINGRSPLVNGGEQVVKNIHTVLNAARSTGIAIIHTQEIHRKQIVDFGRELDGNEPIHCLENTNEIEIVDPLKPIDGEFLIQKRRYSSFFGTDLDILLRGLKINSLIIAGFLTDVCVHYTAADAHQHDYFVKIISDAAGGSSMEAHWASIAAIRYLQSSSEVNSEEVVRWLHANKSQA
ncbi:cysteine hydrolase [Paenibacillus sp. FSL H7-0326]|uniref:cysteine hydrolase family protein n=1 Tax=Paenibacillus sp. FSL H7-0326 TaxID=1921144 RepID=UPI00096BFF2D|nr:isochorismatase family cysteine hydrolase [Paenibacillus sp. FSL H7-0326]OMC71410.1 cysteine hydrolase [Paenibacillus sp. FSL H7-0326]